MINITDDARAKLISILAEEKTKAIRFGLQGGGCSGFSYFFALESDVVEDDLQVQLDANHILVIDSMSSMYLDGAEIDFKTDVMGQNFVFNNPNATTSCGCGNSVGF